MKLLIGAGDTHYEGYETVDYYHTADHTHNLELPLPFDKNSVEEIVGYHVIEHLDHTKILEAVKSWYRALMIGGKLVLEFPDLDAVLQWCLKEHSTKSLEWLFGTHDRPGQIHKWGYTKESMRALLVAAGFPDDKITFPEPQDYHKDDGPCLRVEAQKL